MTKSFWQINRNLLDLIIKVEEAEGDITGELEEALAINRNDADEKILQYLGLIDALENDIAMIKEDMAKSQAKLNKNENLIDKLKETIKNAVVLYGLDEKMKVSNYNLSVKTTTALKVIDKNQINRSYMRFSLKGHFSLEAKRRIEANMPNVALNFIEEPNKDQIKAALESGQSVGSGCHIQTNKSLVIR